LRDYRGFCILSAARASEKAFAICPSQKKLSKLDRKFYSPFAIGLSRGFSGKGMEKTEGFVRCSDLVTECSGYLGSKTRLQKPSFDYDGNNFVVGCYTKNAANKFAMLGDDAEFEVDIDEDDTNNTDDTNYTKHTQNIVTYSGSFNNVGLVGAQRFNDNNTFTFNNNK